MLVLESSTDIIGLDLLGFVSANPSGPKCGGFSSRQKSGLSLEERPLD